MANKKQLQILEQGVSAWNGWRSDYPSAKINLSKSNLRGIDLQGANLYKANLHAANLHEANLSGANLSGANLRLADVSNANLSQCDFTEANLVNTSLRESVSNKADFTGANLRKANLFKANLIGANFSLANLSFANLNESNLAEAKFTEANLHRATFKEVDLSNLDLNQQQHYQIGDTIFRELQDNLVNYSGTYHEILVAEKIYDSIPVKPVKNIRKQKVHFTASHPIVGKVDEWHTLLVYAHTSSSSANVRKDIEKHSDQIQELQVTTTQSLAQLTNGTNLTIVPTCKDVIFNPESINIKWVENIHRANFRFKANKSLSGDVAKGEIAIYMGPIIIGIVKFAMLFNDKLTKPVEHKEQTTMYEADEIFISYSRKDIKIVNIFKRVHSATGYDVFIDTESLRSGQYWKEELKKRIKRAKIFQMFWSKNYSKSKNCEMEWKHALKQKKGAGYIRPVFWKKPISPLPPKELNKYNFKYIDPSELGIAKSK